MRRSNHGGNEPGTIEVCGKYRISTGHWGKDRRKRIESRISTRIEDAAEHAFQEDAFLPRYVAEQATKPGRI